MSTEAGMLRCPNCGGDVGETARTCTYCHAELLTLRCHACYAMNSARSVHCSGCGRELGLEPVGESDDRECPKCQKALVAFRGTGGMLLDCSGCGGQFVEHDLLSSLLEAREITGLAVLRRSRRAALALGPVRYVPCPACKQLMNRKNFGGESGVVVNVCSRHGTWFDEGELPRVLAFVESGGLVMAHERASQRGREDERARALRKATPAAASGMDPGVDRGDMESLADATMELFEWLASRWKK